MSDPSSAPPAPRVRDATADDAAAIAAILDAEIAGGTANWSAPSARVDGARWLASAAEHGAPVLIAEVAGTVAGFATWSPYRPRWGYRHTVEDSVYLDPTFRRRGVGRLLLGALLQRARASNLHVMVAAIDSENLGGLALHAALGFVEVGRMPEVGRKFETWRDLVLMQQLL